MNEMEMLVCQPCTVEIYEIVLLFVRFGYIQNMETRTVRRHRMHGVQRCDLLLQM